MNITAQKFRNRRSTLWGVEVDGEVLRVCASKSEALDGALSFARTFGYDTSIPVRIVRVSRAATEAK